MDLCLWFTEVDFWVIGFFDSEQLVGPGCHLVYFIGPAFFLKSKIPLCSDDFIIAHPYSMVTITNLFQLGLWPEATLSDAARGSYFLLELLTGIDSHLLSIWTCEAVPDCWLRTSWVLVGWAECCIHCWCCLPFVPVWVPLAALTFRYAAGRAVPFLVLDTKGKCKKQVPNWSADGQNMERTGCGVLTQHAGLLMDTEAVVPSSSAVVLSVGASILGCIMAVSASLAEHVGPAPDLAVAERNHGRSLIELAWLIW